MSKESPDLNFQLGTIQDEQTRTHFDLIRIWVQELTRFNVIFSAGLTVGQTLTAEAIRASKAFINRIEGKFLEIDGDAIFSGDLSAGGNGAIGGNLDVTGDIECDDIVCDNIDGDLADFFNVYTSGGRYSQGGTLKYNDKGSTDLSGLVDISSQSHLARMQWFTDDRSLPDSDAYNYVVSGKVMGVIGYYQSNPGFDRWRPILSHNLAGTVYFTQAANDSVVRVFNDSGSACDIRIVIFVEG